MLKSKILTCPSPFYELDSSPRHDLLTTCGKGKTEIVNLQPPEVISDKEWKDIFLLINGDKNSSLFFSKKHFLESLISFPSLTT